MSSLPTFYWPKQVTWLTMIKLKKEKEVHVHRVPVLRTGDNQRRALPGDEKERRDSKETNLTTG